MAHSFASYEGDELTVMFKATWSKADFGVRGSPTWLERVGVEIEELHILGTEVKPTTLSSETLAAIHALAEEIHWEL